MEGRANLAVATATSLEQLNVNIQELQVSCSIRSVKFVELIWNLLNKIPEKDTFKDTVLKTVKCQFFN